MLQGADGDPLRHDVAVEVNRMVTTHAERLSAMRIHYRRLSASTTMAAASCGTGHLGVTLTVTT
jgi:hypothetical protein